MSEAIIVAIITGGLSLIGVIVSNNHTAQSMDAKLARCTKWVAAVFVVLTLVLDCMVAAGIK